MISVEDAATILTETILHDKRHPHYKRVAELSQMYRRFVTGEGLENDLQHIVSRESEDQFKLRKKLFFPLVPAICHRADVPFAKVHRAQGAIERVDYKGGESGDLKARLSKAMDEFWGDEDMSDYFADRFRELNRVDPNAFVMVEFDEFDPVEERAQPYPLEVSSEEAINYSKTNNQVDWMIAKVPHTYRIQGKETPGERYVMYFGDILDFRQVHSDVDAADSFNPRSIETQRVKIANKVFECSVRRPYTNDQSKRFQGAQTGHLKDPATDGKTFISYLHHGKNRMMDTLKAGSEHSLVMALMAFPKIYMYLPSCEGEISGPAKAACTGGKNSQTGQTCKRCHGTGKNIPTSVLDSMVLELPDNFATDGIVGDLSKMMHMFSPDVAIIKAIQDHMHDLEDWCVKDIFTSLQHQRGKVSATATEVLLDAESFNDSLHPYARKVSTARTAIVYAVAAFVDADKDLEYTHRFPEDFRLAPLGALLDDLNKATTAGASPIVLELIEDDVVAKKLRDRPLELRKYEVQKLFRPLAHISKQERASALASGDGITEAERILILHEKEIYRVLGQDPAFWEKNQEAQKALIDAEVAKVMTRIQEAKANEVDFSEPEPAE